MTGDLTTSKYLTPSGSRAQLQSNIVAP